jgi:hypothetical protein
MLKTTAKRSLLILITLLQVVFFPRMSYADGTTPSDPGTTPPAATTTPDPATTTTTTPDPATTPPVTPPVPATGPTSPTGADGKTYHYNPATGLWENDYYTWNPATGQTAPKNQPTYSYNPATGKWDTTTWRYDAPTGQYVANVVATPTPPAGSTTTGGVTPQAASLVSPLSGSPLVGPDSTNAIDTSSANAGAYNLFYNANISNNVNSTATTGDATVAQNTLGGNAGTGNASDMATVLNMLQSVWNPSNGPIATFTANVDGNVTGDLMIDPGASPQNLTTNNSTTNDLKINANQNANINNDINLAAASGNATVTGNTTAGDATTGTAKAVANVVNLLNSYITSGTSFVGTVNINGDLNGDILLPQDMLTQLLASNVPRTTINTSNINNNNILAQFNDTTNIKNNVNANATTGTATVADNTNAGNATSGAADTNVTILNLTGRDIIGSNAMLVFVNVLGKWVGMIMDAPGATSAALGGGVTTNTTNNNLDVNSTSNTGITNNINVGATSGNADVSKNTNAGNATTGDATASANIANVSNSHLSLGGWFGVLFINVFGNWFGSFGVNTSAGDKPVTPPAPKADVKVFQFVPAASNTENNSSYHLASVPTTGNLGTGTTTQPTQGEVLGASTVQPVYAASVKGGLNPVAKAYIVLAFAGLIIMGGGKLLAFLKSKKATV